MTALRSRVDALAGLPPLCDISAEQRAELDGELELAETLEDLPGKWQAAISEAELRAAGEGPGSRRHCH